MGEAISQIQNFVKQITPPKLAGLKILVESEGFEPSSKHGIDKLSTYISFDLIVGDRG